MNSQEHQGSIGRIFVNKNLEMNKIKFFGFDMDYTLAMYKSPELEIMSFELVAQRLVEIGYPKDILNIKYDPSFAIRGVWADRKLGNLLKTDNFGHILTAFHGLRKLHGEEIMKMYPNKFIKYDSKRIMVINTIYNLPETFMIGAIIDHYEKSPDCYYTEQGIKFHSDEFCILSYTCIMQDIREAMDFIHRGPSMKKVITNDLPRYVERDERTRNMLIALMSSGAKTFLLTNSDHNYTKTICEYILFCKENGSDWKEYFDVIVTDARKPLFFQGGSMMRLLNQEENHLEVGQHNGPLKKGEIYSGGSAELFTQFIGSKGGTDVLYFGDHIFGDILKSKKACGWRTCLIVPELENEIRVWQEKAHLFEELERLNCELGEMFKTMDIVTKNDDSISDIKKKMTGVNRAIERSYGKFGSVLRNGNRLTFLAGQVQMYADIYTNNCVNLTNYPLFYMFEAPYMMLPHEFETEHRSEEINTPSKLGIARRYKSSSEKNSSTEEEK